MKNTTTAYLLILFCHTNIFSQKAELHLTLTQALDSLALISTTANIEKIRYKNDILLFENYKKSFLPSLSFSLNPINFNRSLRILQHPTDGSYSYIEDYSNNSNAGISIRQKLSLTGGEINIGSNINYLNEFTRKQSSFSTSAITLGYTQQLLGGNKQLNIETKIEYAKNKISLKEYCTELAQIQQNVLELFMKALLSKMEKDLAYEATLSNDTLMQLARIKIANGNITEYELKQIELQLINAQYAYENASKKYIVNLERLAVFLGISEVDIEIPYFDVPLAIDAHIVMFYVKRNNPFSKKQEIQQLEAEKNLITTKLSNQFNGNISLRYGVNQYADNFADAYRNGNTQQSILIGFQIPVFQWGINKNRIQIAKNNYAASKLAIDKQIREFETEIKEHVNNYNQSVKLWFTAEKAYHLSQEQYKLITQKFSLGKVSVYELKAAQNDQDNAMQRYYSAIKDTYFSYYKLRTMALYDFKHDVELEELFIND